MQFNNDKVSRFRFVEKQGTKEKVGLYSGWQEQDLGAPHNFNDDTDMPAALTYFSTQCYDQKIWRTNIGLRKFQTWDLLHSVPLIGMSRKQIIDLLGTESSPPKQKLDNVGYYRLNSPGDSIPSPLLYLELKYSNDRVVAFQTETLTENWRVR